MYPKDGWFISGKILLKWMTGGTPGFRKHANQLYVGKMGKTMPFAPQPPVITNLMKVVSNGMVTTSQMAGLWYCFAQILGQHHMYFIISLEASPAIIACVAAGPTTCRI